MDQSSRPNRRPGRKGRTYRTRMRRRRRRQRLEAICCLAVFYLGFLSGKAVTLRMMKQGNRNAEVQAAAGYTIPGQRQEQIDNDKTELTGIIYEPWHFRYVGKEAAAEIMEREICLEEYLSAD